MCGIHGFCWQDTDKSTVTKMIRVAHHRGPDGNGTWGNQFITLGHNLLAISDEPSLSSQPWHHADCVLVFNGEIYNYRELRKELNYTFVTDTDTEVLAVGLKQHGLEFLYKLDGMFALAFYNKTTNKLLLARDSNGTKPLYYCRIGGKLAFSSEIKSLLEIGHPRVVSKEGFKHYYYSGLVAGPMTIFEGILKLIPGEIVSVNLHNEATLKVNINNSPIQSYDGEVDDIPAILSDKLRQAVRMTLMGKIGRAHV